MKTSNDTLDAILSLFVGVPDPRKKGLVLYPLEMLLFCAVGAFICHGEAFTHMALFAKLHEKLLSELFGTTRCPSHDTFARLFARLDGKLFSACLTRLAERLGDIGKRRIVAIDGKTCRRAGDSLRKAAHIVSAWSPGEKLVLGMTKVDEKTNEITAVPELLLTLGKMLSGSVITVDAMNTQKKNAGIIVSLGADYVFSLKNNHSCLYERIKLFLDAKAASEAPGFSSVGKGHGRMERRRCWQSDDLGWLSEASEWPGLRSVCMIERESEHQTSGKSSVGRRYFLSSLPMDPERIAKAIREHWDIENGCHWVLDVVTHEDYSRARVDNAARNLRALRSICQNFLTSAKRRLEDQTLEDQGSRIIMRLHAAMDPKYLFQILGINSSDKEDA